MNNTLLGALIGPSGYTSAANTSAAQQQYNNAAAQGGQAYAAQQAYNSAMGQQAYAQHISGLGTPFARYKPSPFRINGKDMELEEFITTLFPADSAEATFLRIKLTKGE